MIDDLCCDYTTSNDLHRTHNALPRHSWNMFWYLIFAMRNILWIQIATLLSSWLMVIEVLWIGGGLSTLKSWTSELNGRDCGAHSPIPCHDDETNASGKNVSIFVLLSYWNDSYWIRNACGSCCVTRAEFLTAKSIYEFRK